MVSQSAGTGSSKSSDEHGEGDSAYVIPIGYAAGVDADPVLFEVLRHEYLLALRDRATLLLREKLVHEPVRK